MESEESASPYSGFRNTVLYYETDDSLMVPVMRQIPWEEGIGRAALSYLVESEENKASIAPYGLQAPIPDGTKISLRIDEDGHARVALSDLPPEALEKGAQNMVSAIVNTLTEFPSIQSVSVSANGVPIGDLTGESALSGSLSAMALNAEDSPIATSTGQSYPMTLYFPNRSGSLMIPVTRYCETHTDFASAMQALIEGPQNGALLSCFPEGTSLLDAQIEDGVATVDLSSAYGAVEDTEGLMDAGYDAMRLTAQAYGDIVALDILVEGEPYAMDSVSTLAPVYANTIN